jgi:hypothetical protein
VSIDLDSIQTQYQAGRAAFERGNYRNAVQHLETANSLVEPTSRLGGQVQIWLVTAYQAVGNSAAAIALCRQLSHHPDDLTRKQGKRLLYILEAPQLKPRSEWLTEIPDLSRLSDRTQSSGGTSQYGTAKPAGKPLNQPKLLPEPVDLTQVNTQENQFVWLALIAIGLVLGGLIWLS